MNENIMLSALCSNVAGYSSGGVGNEVLPLSQSDWEAPPLVRRYVHGHCVYCNVVKTGMDHWRVAKRVLRYLRGTVHMRLVSSRTDSLDLFTRRRSQKQYSLSR
jgi:hypothetical protein